MVNSNDNGYTQLNGALSAFTNCEKALMELGAKLGLDPSSRTNIAAPRRDQPGPNPFAING
jgi:phage terminase small subunit